MSMELHVYVTRANAPDASSVRAAIAELGLPIEIDSDWSPLDDSGFLPCRLNGNDTGVELEFVDDSEELDPPHAAVDRDAAFVFTWGSDMESCACALGIGAAMLRAAGALVYYPADDLTYDAESLMAEYQAAVASVEG